MIPPVLTTERLLLRRPEYQDAPSIHRLASDRAIAETTLYIPHPYPEGAADQWIRRCHESSLSGEQISFIILRRMDGELIGSIGLTRTESHHRAELGYWIGKPYWGQGFATEAAQRMVRFGFEEMGLNKITAGYYTKNGASRRVQEKIGMRHEGVLRDHYFKWGEYLDVAVTGLLRSEYEALQNGSGSSFPR